MNAKVTRIIKYTMERFMEREVPVVAMACSAVIVSKERNNLNREAYMAVTKDVNLAISFGMLLGISQQSTGVASGEVKQCKPFSSIDYYVAGTILGEIWTEMVQEQCFEGLMGLAFGIEGLGGHFRFYQDMPDRRDVREFAEPKAVRREIHELTDTKFYFEGLSRSHKIAQLCQNLQHIPNAILADMLKIELPAVSALLLRFVDDPRQKAILQRLDPVMRAEVIKFLESGNSTAATELMLATLGFVTYAPLPARLSEDTPNNVGATSGNPDVH